MNDGGGMDHDKALREQDQREDSGTTATSAAMSPTRSALAQKVGIPSGYRLEWSGQFEYLERAKAKLTIVVPITLVIIFVLLYLKFLQAHRDVGRQKSGYATARIWLRQPCCSAGVKRRSQNRSRKR